MNRKTRRALGWRGQRNLLRGTVRIAFAGLGATSLPASGGTSAAAANPLALPRMATIQPRPADGAGTPAIATAQASLGVPEVLASARRAFGARFAGWWIDNSGSAPVLRIMVAGAKDARAESIFRNRLAPQMTRGTRITYGTKYTLGQLGAFVDAIGSYMKANWHRGGDAPSHNIIITVDPVDNAVEIILAHQDARFLRPLQALVPTDALRIQWNDSPAFANTQMPGALTTQRSSTALQPHNGPGWENNVSQSTFPPYKAGLYTRSASVKKGCTTGFMLEVEGTYKGVTAGHCANATDALWSTGGGQMGQGLVPIWSLGTGGDYDVFALSNWGMGRILAESTYPTNPPKAFVDNVVGRESDNNQGWGLSVCASGITTNRVACGTVTTEFKTIELNGVGNQMCATYASAQGDSGGPVYVPEPGNAGLAAGIISSRSGLVSCYTTIDSVLQGMTHALGNPAYVVGYNGQRF